MYRVSLFIVLFELVIAGSAVEVSDFQRRKLATFLSAMNGNNDGVLEEKDYHETIDRYVNSCNWKINETKVNSLHNILVRKAWEAFSYDSKGKGKPVTPDEFHTVMPMRVKDPKHRDSFKNLFTFAFSVIDIDDDNLVNLVEYSTMLHQIRGIDTSTAKPYFDALDIDHDNVLTEDEFVTAFFEFVVGADENSPSKWFFGPLD